MGLWCFSNNVLCLKTKQVVCELFEHNGVAFGEPTFGKPLPQQIKNGGERAEVIVGSDVKFKVSHRAWAASYGVHLKKR